MKTTLTVLLLIYSLYADSQGMSAKDSTKFKNIAIEYGQYDSFSVANKIPSVVLKRLDKYYRLGFRVADYNDTLYDIDIKTVIPELKNWKILKGYKRLKSIILICQNQKGNKIIVILRQKAFSPRLYLLNVDRSDDSYVSLWSDWNNIISYIFINYAKIKRINKKGLVEHDNGGDEN